MTLIEFTDENYFETLELRDIKTKNDTYISRLYYGALEKCPEKYWNWEVLEDYHVTRTPYPNREGAYVLYVSEPVTEDDENDETEEEL